MVKPSHSCGTAFRYSSRDEFPWIFAWRSSVESHQQHHSNCWHFYGVSFAGARNPKQRATSFAFGLTGFTLITSAVGFTLAEDVGKDGRVHSFFDTLWWSATTLTTVGYGDIYPITAPGRIIAIFTMIVGVSTLAVVTARIAQFLLTANKEDVQDLD